MIMIFSILCLVTHVAFGFSPSVLHVSQSLRNARLNKHTLQLGLGLTEKEFERSCRLDSTIQKLRVQVPLLLIKALDKQSSSDVYADSVVLVGPNDEELATDRQELVTLSTTLVTASTATRQASKFARSLAVSETPSLEDPFLVSSILVLDVKTLDKLFVQWEVNLLGTSKVSGLSELDLNEEGLVSVHKLQSVKIDGNEVTAVGEALATLRRAVKSVQSSPFLSPLASSFPLLNEIREELLQQATTTAATPTMIEIPPLYAATTTISKDNNNNNNNNIGDLIKNTTSHLTLVDDMKSSIPIPGSSQWSTYATFTREISNFVDRSIPVLSMGSPKDELYDLFSANCTMYGIDGSVVCTGGETVADFYRTLASIRQGTMGKWNIRGIHPDWNSRSVVIDYVANNPVQVEGKDRFTLSEDNLIARIDQLEIVVNDIKVEDPEYFRKLYQALKTGRSATGAKVLLDLLEQANPSSKNSLILNNSSPPQLSESAAASVYAILCTLHKDLASITTLGAPPAAAFLAPNVELKGYLKEVLSKGEGAYRTAIGVALLSLRGALASGRVVMEKPPQPTISFQSDGRIEVDLILKLRIKALPIEQERGIPLKLELISTYRVNKEGKIVEHSIVETRVNDQLTPTDVVTRFLKGTSDEPLPVQSVLDAFNWARNLASS